MSESLAIVSLTLDELKLLVALVHDEQDYLRGCIDDYWKYPKHREEYEVRLSKMLNLKRKLDELPRLNKETT